MLLLFVKRKKFSLKKNKSGVVNHEEIRESFDGKRVVSQNKTTYANASWIQSV